MAQEKTQDPEIVKPLLQSTARCGIVMPISAIDNCSAEHWSEVLTILRDIITKAGFEPNLVSDADEIGIIQKRIIQNLYNNEILVCDVSSKNPNVMFELGIRLAFDKPTIIIKDDKTDYTFDTSVIEHLSYPRDLRYSKIESFKENLKKKIQATYEKSTTDPGYSTFLKSFGEYKIAQLQEKEISSDKFILSALDEIRSELNIVKKYQILQRERIFINEREHVMRTLNGANSNHLKKLLTQLLIKFKTERDIQERLDLTVKPELEEELFNFLGKQRELVDSGITKNELRSILKEVII